MSNPLKPYYPKWRENALESARWLRSGAEYEAWQAKHGLEATIKTPEEREKLAQEYDASAARYLDPNYTGA